MSLNFMTAVTIHSDFGAQENKSVTVSFVSPSICHEVMGSYTMILVFRMLNFKLSFSLSSFTFIKRLLGMFTPSYFIVFDAMVNGIISLPNSVLVSSWSQSLI